MHAHDSAARDSRQKQCPTWQGSSKNAREDAAIDVHFWINGSPLLGESTTLCWAGALFVITPLPSLLLSARDYSISVIHSFLL